MIDFELIKQNYVKLRSAIIKYLDRFDNEAYFYQPTKKSNAPAWIIPHIVAFEKMMVTDKIEGYDFPAFISQKDVAKYKPTVEGFVFTKENMLTKQEAIKLLKKASAISQAFLDELIKNSVKIKDVDQQTAFAKYMLNFGHETEHYGQIKYLLGTYTRMKK